VTKDSVCGLVIGFIVILYTTLRRKSNYSAVVDPHILQITTALLSILKRVFFIGRFLTTAPTSGNSSASRDYGLSSILPVEN
jgi:hypothetical protein